MFDILWHRVPWNGDRIRLYRRAYKQSDVFLGEFYLKIKDGEVWVEGYHGYIRRDLPKWSNRHSCWEYWYTDAGGE